MRIGSFLRLARLAENLSLRKFAPYLGIPSSTLSALEQGWVAPTQDTTRKLLDFLIRTKTDTAAPVESFINLQFSREHCLRQTGDSLLASLCLTATGLLRAFMDTGPWDYCEPAPQATDLRDQIYYDQTLPEDLSKTTKVAILSWSLIKEEPFILVEGSQYFQITKPTAHIKHVLSFIAQDEVEPTMPQRLEDIPASLAGEHPRYVPDPILALDIILTICSRMGINPMNPGEIISYLTSYSGVKRRVEAFYPMPTSVSGRRTNKDAPKYFVRTDIGWD